MWFSSNQRKTPACARPSAPPPSRTRPMVGRPEELGDAGALLFAGLSCPKSPWAHTNTDRRMAKQRLIFIRNSGMKKYSWRAHGSWKNRGRRLVVLTSLNWRDSGAAARLAFKARLHFHMTRRILLKNGQHALGSRRRRNPPFPDNFLRAVIPSVNRFVTAVIGTQGGICERDAGEKSLGSGVGEDFSLQNHFGSSGGVAADRAGSGGCVGTNLHFARHVFLTRQREERHTRARAGR